MKRWSARRAERDRRRAEAEKRELAEIDRWRGVRADESGVEISNEGARFLRRRSLRLLGSLLRPFRLSVGFVVVLILLENVARLSVPTLVQRGIDLGVPPLRDADDAGPLMATIGMMLIALVVQASCQVSFLSLSGRVAQGVLLAVRRRLFRHFQRLDVAFHDKYTSGRVVSRLTNDVEAIGDLLEQGIDGLVTSVLTLVGVAAVMLWLDWRLALVALLSFPFLLALARWFSVNSTRAYRKVRELSAMNIVQFVESMTGIRAVQAYRREPRNQEIYTDLTVRYEKANEHALQLNAVFMPGVVLIGAVTTAVTLTVGGLWVINGSMSIGVLAAFLLYLRMFFQPMQEISQFYNLFQAATSALEKTSGVLEEEPRVVDPSDPTPLEAGVADATRGEITFDRVSFGYADDRQVLTDFDLTIPAGQTVALVGTTGAGKTTIATLVARFHDPTSGALRLDGVDLRDVGDADLRANITLLTQENFMFDGTIAENIAVGRPDASRSEIEDAARAVGADTWIEEMPGGYDTDVAKRGGRLSAGQRQLVAFARVFLADPRVLILDEATSSLDIPSERLVQQALQTVLQDRTAIIIAHRLSTVAIADRVLVLEHGRVIEDGAPDDLLQVPDGHYARLHRAWEESLA